MEIFKKLKSVHVFALILTSFHQVIAANGDASISSNAGNEQSNNSRIETLLLSKSTVPTNESEFEITPKTLAANVGQDHSDSIVGVGDGLFPEARSFFSPKMDYNEWMPVGRGDPLKNDPTYDYSPPTLDNVKYWPDSGTNSETNSKSNDKSNTNEAEAIKEKQEKSEILLLGIPSRKQSQPTSSSSSTSTRKDTFKNNNSIRRSYYSSGSGGANTNYLPTRLMPPPMPTLSPLKQTSTEIYHQNNFQSGFGYNSGYSKGSMNYSPWSSGSGYYQGVKYSNNGNFNNNHDSQSVGSSINYVSISSGSGQKLFSGRPSDFNSYSTNSPPVRKPWLHELLQQEIAKPSASSTSSSGIILSTPIEISSSNGFPMGSTTAVHISSTSPHIVESNESIPGPISVPYKASTSPVYTTTKSYSTTTEKTTTSMIFQPTIPSSKMTTDVLFSHYKQPSNPLYGPMYLIIQGHSKVKTYGSNDNETDLHQPKIVPVPAKENVVINHVTPKIKIEKIIESSTTSTNSLPTLKDEKKLAAIKNKIENIINLSTTTAAAASETTTTTEEPSPMQNLLSLLDTSLGNFFMNEIDPTAKNSSIVANRQNNNVGNDGCKNSTVVKKETTEKNEEKKETRQVFDYDDLPESNLEEFLLGFYSDSEDNGNSETKQNKARQDANEEFFTENTQNKEDLEINNSKNRLT